MIKKFVKRWLGIIDYDDENLQYPTPPILGTASIKPYRQNHPLPRVRHLDNELSANEKFSFRVFTAGGGKVVEFRSYDKQQDEERYRLHIISDDEDFAAELGKVVMIELLRN